MNGEKKIQKHKIANAKIKKSSVVLMKLLKTAGSQSEEAMKEAVDNHLKNLNKLASDLLSENDMEIKIGISTMLNFLVRKYKDDRNLIIHGNFEPFNHKWKNYINYAALMKIFEIYKKYDELYT